jgi:hypothetical protein
MAINLTYDPSNDPETVESEDQRDAESLEIGEKLAEEQEQLLAGKYKDAEELEQAYIELQKKIGSESNKTEDEPKAEQEETTEEKEEVDVTETEQALMNADDEFDANGKLSDETIESLSQLDSRELIETYQNIQAKYAREAPANTPLTEESIDAIQNAVGGEESYNQMVDWAKSNFSAEEIAAYDGALAQGNLNTINFALQALYYRYQDAVGYDGEMIQGKPAQAVDGFRSQQEVVRAMGDPRYENDPAYRQDVYDKLERSQLQF